MTAPTTSTSSRPSVQLRVLAAPGVSIEQAASRARRAVEALLGAIGAARASDAPAAA